MKNVKRLVIDRSRWLCGEGSERSFLYRKHDRKMCCLGFYARELGCKVNDIVKQQSPEETPAYFPDWLINENDEGKSDRNTTECYALMNVNDSKLLSNKEREQTVKNAFKKHGVDVKFVGSYKKK